MVNQLVVHKYRPAVDPETGKVLEAEQAAMRAGIPLPVIAKGQSVQMYVGDAWTLWRVAHIQPVHGGKRMATVTLLREDIACE